MRKSICVIMIVPAVLLLCGPVAVNAAIQTYGFANITENSATNAAAGEAQLWMDVISDGLPTNQVAFRFRNVGLDAMSITDVYFDDGTLLGIDSVINGSVGVDFSQGATPWNLPGGRDLDPVFLVTKKFSQRFTADSNPPTQPNGVNPGEWVEIVVDLQPGKSYTDVLSALAQATGVGGLRVGIHVQGFSNGRSESFVNDGAIPEPASLVVWSVLGAAGAGLSLARRRRTTGWSNENRLAISRIIETRRRL